MKNLQLNDGRTMPQLGLGLMRFGSVEETEAAFVRGVAAGYRLFDTAAVYGNERETGAAIRAAGLPRGELFITTKLWNADQGRETTRAALASSLARLGLDYVDLYLIHWPLPMFDRYLETWREMIALREEGLIRSIGVSNFNIDHLERVIGETGVAPAVNQVELHPRFQQRALREFLAGHGIVAQAWSPMGGGGTGRARLTDDPIITAIAARRGCSPAQVIIAWLMAIGVSAIPKATSAAHLAENMAALEVRLDDGDLAELATLDSPDGRSGPDPATMDIRRAL